METTKTDVERVIERERRERSELDVNEERIYEIEITQGNRRDIQKFINYLIFSDLKGKVLVHLIYIHIE